MKSLNRTIYIGTDSRANLYVKQLYCVCVCVYGMPAVAVCVIYLLIYFSKSLPLVYKCIVFTSYTRLNNTTRGNRFRFQRKPFHYLLFFLTVNFQIFTMQILTVSHLRTDIRTQKYLAHNLFYHVSITQCVCVCEKWC